MDTLLTTPSATAFDAVSSLASAGVYMIVALAAFAHAPRDPRVRVFLATAIAGVAPYCVTAQIWAWGAGPTFSKGTIVLLAFSLMIGSLALFHFTQLFPWRRPWIRAHAGKLRLGYIVTVIVAGLAASLLSRFDLPAVSGPNPTIDDAEVYMGLALVAIAMPVVFVLGVVVPFAGVLSLAKTWQTARARGNRPARLVTGWMLASQMGGGVLTILIVPLLHLVAPRGPWVIIASALLFASAVLMPLAFAAGVWKFHILELDIEALPQ